MLCNVVQSCLVTRSCDLVRGARRQGGKPADFVFQVLDENSDDLLSIDEMRQLAEHMEL
eukprot:SAG22_NODE_1065_length_5752_cov_12.512294_5_plen_59_part_00